MRGIRLRLTCWNGWRAGKADTVILVTRNARMETAQLALAQAICARNPYGAGLIEGADSVICSNGDSGPTLEAAGDAIFGVYRPGVSLTVEI